MASSSDSAAPSQDPYCRIELEIQELHPNICGHNFFLQTVLDDEGGHHLALVDEDMLHIREDVSASLAQIEQAMITKHVELELLSDRLEL